MKKNKSKSGDYSILFKELNRLKLERIGDSQEIGESELDEIANLRKAVIEVSSKHYIYCTTT